MKWEAELDELQHEAVTHGEGPLKIIAGAGAGKTRTLMYRAAYLQMERGIDPEHLLLMTFTRAATHEMHDRAAALIPDDGGPGMKIATQHAWAINMLRPYTNSGDPTLLGSTDLRYYDDNGRRLFPLLTDTYYIEAWKRSAEDAGEKDFPYYRAARIVSKAKNCLRSCDDLEQSSDEDEQKAAKIWKSYTEYCIENRKMDFDDVLVEMAGILDDPAVAALLQRRYPWVLVDECQDLSPVQWQIIERLCPPPDANLTIVGDDDQSIYGFRGATPGKLISFEEKYDAKVIKLEKNYRSTKSIVECASDMIDHNTARQEKKPFSEIVAEREPLFALLDDEDHEADEVSQQVAEWKSLGYKYSDMAILVRCWWQTCAFEDIFIQKGIPYKIWGGTSFYRRKEINALARYFRLAVEPLDSEALLADSIGRSVLNVPLRYLGKAAWTNLNSFASRNRHLNVYQLLTSCRWSKPWMARNARELGDDIVSLSSWLDKTQASPRELLTRIMEVFDYENYLLETYDRSEDRLDNVKALLSVSEKFQYAQDFAEYLKKRQYGLTPSSDGDEVQILTIHRAKGQEWPCVAAVGFADRILPHFRADTLDEERRLAYVSVTRAERELLVTGAHEYKDSVCAPSVFTEEMGFGG